MFIRVVRNGIAGKWEKHSKKNHRALLKNPPEAVYIRIKQFFENCPDSGVHLVAFEVFNVLAREFVLQENKQKKQDTRHLDMFVTLDDLGRSKSPDFIGDVTVEYEDAEEVEELHSALKKLSPAHRRRLVLHYSGGLTMKEIGDLEGVNLTSAWRGLKVARKKLLRRMETDAKRHDFVSDYSKGEISATESHAALLVFVLDKASGTMRIKTPGEL